MKIPGLRLQIDIEKWPYKTPFKIAGYTFEIAEVLVVTLEQDGLLGRGEAAGVYYKKDTPRSMLAQLESVRDIIETGIDRSCAQHLLPAGGARNALDCALWDLEAKQHRIPAWKLAGLDPPRPLITTFTCGADDPSTMAATARAYTQARAIKIKLTGEAVDTARIYAVREARPDVWLGVDANQALNPSSLQRLMPVLTANLVDLIEQPFPVGQEALMDGLDSPIPIAADETVQTLADIASVAGRFAGINIKLDKCGGLTEALAMARAASKLGLDIMIGNMPSTSLAMAPAFLVGQFCKIVDLDGPALIEKDRPIPVVYKNGSITCPEGLWG